MIRVLIADDSSFMRVTIKTLLESDKDIKVAGIARTGKEAIDKTHTLKPDVITMDINMPDMSGIDAVKHIMKKHPVPVIMISSLTTEGAEETIEALKNGAVDYINKSQLTGESLISKVRMAAKASISQSACKSTGCVLAAPIKQTFAVIGIGISTGGPRALSKLIPEISPAVSASIVIAQHMPPVFTKSLAERLDAESMIKVKEAKDGDLLQPGCAYILPGGMHGKVQKGGFLSLYSKEALPQYHYTPSVDVLMSSIAQVYRDKALCIIMTGMGSDGLEGIMEARKSGSYVIAQSESTCTIFGMPKAVIENNLHNEIVHLDDIGLRINKLCIAD
ncbi:MAG TPA: chemotaxis response regulator protein-glutamate methylesterase [Clostridiales bacterium]|nr:chemotaxis response regulator protein-glutamate methylesterase [Clostridiales bacterium]